MPIETFSFADIIDDVEVAPVEREEFDTPRHGQTIDDLPPIPVDEDEEDEIPEDEITEDVEETDESEPEEADEGEVDYDEYNITLPNGEDVKLSDLVNGYRDNTALEHERAELTRVRDEFLDKAQHLNDYMVLSEMEADSIIKEYKDFDWNGLRRSDPEEYLAHRDYFDNAVQRKEDLKGALERRKEQEEQENARQRQIDAREANAILARDIPDWGQPLWDEIYSYGVSVGHSEEFLSTCTDAAAIKTLHKAMQFDKGQKVVKAKVRKLGSPTKVVKSEGDNKPAPVNNSKLFDKIARGQASKQDKAAAFLAIKHG